MLGESPRAHKTKDLKNTEFEEVIDPHKKSFLRNLNKNASLINTTNQNQIFLSNPNTINTYNSNITNQKPGSERTQAPAFTTKPAQQANLIQQNAESLTNNKINPNKFDAIDVGNKNIINPNNADILTSLEETEINPQNNYFNNETLGEEFKIKNFLSSNNQIENPPNLNAKIDINNNSNNNAFINNNYNGRVEGKRKENTIEILKANKQVIQDSNAMNLKIDLQESLNNNKQLENVNNAMNISNREEKIVSADNFFDKQMDEESLVNQLDKIDFFENSNLKLIPGKGCDNNQLPAYLQMPEANASDRNKNPNIDSNPLIFNNNIHNNNNNQTQNVNSENAIIKDLFGNENLMKNDSYSSMSICPNTSVEEYNEYLIKSETDLDLIFDMIYKSQKISLDVMYNLRNKLRVRGYNTVLSLRLKKDREKSWKFLYDDYKDISPEMEALALLIEYYLEKKANK